MVSTKTIVTKESAQKSRPNPQEIFQLSGLKERSINKMGNTTPTAVLPVEPSFSQPAYNMITLASLYEAVRGVLRGNSTSLGNIVIIVVILGLELLFQRNLFECPCDVESAEVYGWFFLFAPAISLFAVGILINNTTWYLITGCVYRRPGTYHGYKQCGMLWAGILWRALVAPVTWLFFGLLDGRYVQCAMAQDPCSQNETARDRNARTRVASQLASWIMLSVVVMVALTGLILCRSFSRLTFEQNRYMQYYRKVERAEKDRQFEERAQRIAQANVEDFLKNDKRSKKDWDLIARMPVLKFQLDEPAEQKFTALSAATHNKAFDANETKSSANVKDKLSLSFDVTKPANLHHSISVPSSPTFVDGNLPLPPAKYDESPLNKIRNDHHTHFFFMRDLNPRLRTPEPVEEPTETSSSPPPASPPEVRRHNAQPKLTDKGCEYEQEVRHSEQHGQTNAGYDNSTL